MRHTAWNQSTRHCQDVITSTERLASTNPPTSAMVRSILFDLSIKTSPANIAVDFYLPYRVSREGKAMGIIGLSVRLFVCPSVRPSACFQSFYLLNRLTFELQFETINRLTLKVKVIGQGQRSMTRSYGRVDAVTRSVWPQSSTKLTHWLVKKITLALKATAMVRAGSVTDVNVVHQSGG